MNFESFVNLHPYNLLQTSTLYIQSFIPSSTALYQTLILHPMQNSIAFIYDNVCHLFMYANDAILHFIPRSSDVENSMTIMPYVYPQQIITVLLHTYDTSTSSISNIIMQVHKLATKKYQSLIILCNNQNINKEKLQLYYSQIQNQSIQSCRYISNVVYKYYHFLNDACFQKALTNISNIHWNECFRRYLVAIYSFVEMIYHRYLDGDCD